MSFWQKFAQAVEFGLDVANAVQRNQQFAQVLSADRQFGMNFMEYIVNNLPAGDLDRFEVTYLDYATSQPISDVYRRRAMELYAWLKLCELQRYGQFRGFVGNG